MGLFYILFAKYNGSWRNHLGLFTAIPLLFFGVLWYLIYDYRDDETECHKEEKSKIARIETNNFI